MHQRRCDWIDAQISKVVLGQTGTTDSKQGAHASGAIHRLVQEDIERFDASLLSITLQKQAVVPQIDLTFGVQAMGQYPRIRVGRPDEPSITEVTNALQWLGPQGVTVRATEVRQRLGFSEPEDGDEVVGGRAPLSAPTAAHTLPAKTRPDQITPPHDNPPNPKEGDEKTTLHSRIVNLVQRQGGADTPALINAMSSQLASRAAKAWSEMSDPVQNAIKDAADFDEAQDRIAELDLPIDAFAQALEQSVQLAYLMGDAMALDQMRQDNA
ncbi:phage portal protein family protein [Acetobacter orientalis]|uniref:phage portal protein family protein n=1 Tax=Acetobacter orientalis TaxID=146474 RepID=UPI00343B5661